MVKLKQVEVPTRSTEHFAHILGTQRMRELEATRRRFAQRLAGRTFWNVNTTAVGGGVAEMLQPLLGYAHGAGLDARWIVIQGNPDFFRITKRIHHALHGAEGDGSPLDGQARKSYEDTLRDNAEELCQLVRANDIVLLHDPQTVGLAQALRARGANLIWRCHIGTDRSSPEAEQGWNFLRPYLQEIPAYVFSRRTYVPECCDHGKSHIIRPSIDAFSVKNQEMDEAAVRAILVRAGLIENSASDTTRARHFVRSDGTPGTVERMADVVRSSHAPRLETPLIVQISRWDPLKDMLGVLRGFELLIENEPCIDAELVLAGPNVSAVTDDPEGAEVFNQVLEAWEALPATAKSRVHLANLPTDDIDENAAIVNALQRHAAIIVQKSLKEGFGLTVTEAMWKARPVIASAVGGIQDQIIDGIHGLLLKDPSDYSAFSSAMRKLLTDHGLAERLGRAAHERVRDEFLGPRHMSEYTRLLEHLNF